MDNGILHIFRDLDMLNFTTYEVEKLKFGSDGQLIQTRVKDHKAHSRVARVAKSDFSNILL
jgi:hypothetical protein